MPTQTKQLQTELMPTGEQLLFDYVLDDLSAIYDRIYNIADRLFKKYNPCNIYIKEDKVTCIGKTDPCKALCCYKCSPFCGLSGHHYWDNGCTVKCLGCKLFLCWPAKKKFPALSKKLYKLCSIADKYELPSDRYYFPKEKWLKQISKGVNYANTNSNKR